MKAIMNTANQAQTLSRLILLMPVITLGISSIIGSGGGGDGRGTATYTIGGTVTGLDGTVVLQNNNGDDLSLSSNGEFTFDTALEDGSTYDVTTLIHPATQTCDVTSNNGVVSAADVTDITIDCLFNSGSLDTSFGSDGLVSWSRGDFPNDAYAMTIDAAGRILVASWIATEVVTLPEIKMTIWRYTADGSLDTSFDNDGIVIYDIPNWNSFANDIILDADGRILVVGLGASAGGAGANPEMMIWRYLTDGSIDTSFGTNGVVVYDRLAGTDFYGRDITLDADGRILVTGTYSPHATGGDRDMVIWRYLANGSLDTSFDTDGVVIYSEPNELVDSSAMTIDDSGRILVAGSIDGSMAIWRYLADGTIDTGFGTNGITLSSSADSNAMSLDVGGRILVAGSTDGSMAIWRYWADGTADTSFGTNGMASYGDADSQAMDLDASGRILVTGSIGGIMTIWRYTDTGNLDLSFDSVGHVSWTDGSTTGGFEISTDASGRILVTGKVSSLGDGGIGIWRYHP